MRKTAFAVLLALLYCVSGAAQTPDEWQPPKGLPYGNEIGIRYGAQIQLGSGGRLSPDLQASASTMPATTTTTSASARV